MKWRSALAVGNSARNAEETSQREEAVRRLNLYRNGPDRKTEADAPPIYSPGAKVEVLPDEDDDFTEPFQGSTGEATWNMVFDQYIYPVSSPDGQEHWVFEEQLKPV